MKTLYAVWTNGRTPFAVEELPEPRRAAWNAYRAIHAPLHLSVDEPDRFGWTDQNGKPVLVVLVSS